MPNTPNNRPAGRQRVGGGAGHSVGTHGPGMGTGPVGKNDGYAQRPGPSGSHGGQRNSGGGQRASGGGRGKLILIIIIAIVVLAGGGTGLSGLLGGGTDTDVTPVVTQQQSSGIGSGSSGSLLAGLLGSASSFSGNSSYDAGWTGTDNTGRLNTSVDSAARAKRLALRGDGTDTVTVMVYLCGTDLESKSGMATNDLKEMASASLSDKVNVIVYTGGCKNWKLSGVSNSSNQIYQVQKNGKLKLLEKNRGSAAMTKPDTLTDFITYCKQNFPADRNELILWDHGGGTVSGFGYDERVKNSGSMTLPDIAGAVKKAGVSFDFIGFDACLMGTLETALVLEPYADYLLASEETEPGIGWYYTNWLTTLSNNTAIPTTELAKQIIDDFISVCGQKCPGQKATLSLVDLAELSATVGGKLSDFSAATAKQISGSGYSAVSKARGDTKEFGGSNKLDQIDLVHLALNLDTAESRALADTLLSAVKYNRTSSAVSNAYGISAYFPYRSAGKVNKAVQQLDAIGFDKEYTDCVKKFASLEVTGQAAGGGSTSPFGSLFGSLTGMTGSASSSSTGSVTDLVGSLLGGGSTSSGLDLAGLLGGAGIFDRSIPESEYIDVVENNRIDDSALVWTYEGGERVLKLSEQQWALVADLQLNVFLDDGSGYIDLGLDNIFSWTDGGDLVGEYDGMWVALNNQPVAYYYTDCTDGNGETITNGRIPVLLNGDRAELLVRFDNNGGQLVGARLFYADGETDTVAKSLAELQEGDVIQPICDRYDYNGNYEDTYRLGGEIVCDGALAVTDVTLDPADGTPVAAYVLTDRFSMEHWTPAIG
ncbi:MAG: peptidase C11 [Clostridia bacterium]|nr:peptidase C11 [Clostridia bacterium]